MFHLAHQLGIPTVRMAYLFMRKAKLGQCTASLLLLLCFSLKLHDTIYPGCCMLLTKQGKH